MVERLVANEKVVGSSPIARSKKEIFMTDLADKKCIPCEGGIPGFDITEIHKYLKISKKKWKFSRYFLERAKGLEPSTFSLATRRSTTELCPRIY